MPNAIRIKLEPIPVPVRGEVRRINGVRVVLTKGGPGSTNAVAGSRVPATLEFHAAHLSKAEDSPGQTSKFASLEGELELVGPDRVPLFTNGRGADGRPNAIVYTEPFEPEVRPANRDTPRRKSIRLQFDPRSFVGMDVENTNSHLLLPEEPQAALYLEIDTVLTVAGAAEAEIGKSDPLDVPLKGVFGDPVPPTSVAIKLFSDDGSQPSGVRFELTDVDGNVHRGELDDVGEAEVDGLTPGRCQLVLEGLAPGEWGARPKAGATSTSYRSPGEEDLPKIAVDNGFQSWRTIFELEENAQFRALRPSPNHLAKDDELTLPPTEAEPVPVATGQVHMFRLESRPPELLRLRIEVEEPFSYELTVAGMTFHGDQEPGGIIEHLVPPNATEGELVLFERGGDPATGERFELLIGALEPVETDKGVQARLFNLGFDPQGVDGKIGDKTRAAIEQFQLAVGLPVTREADEATRAELVRRHDAAAATDAAADDGSPEPEPAVAPAAVA